MISVFGNGESRKHLDLNSLTETKVGCNAIHRDYSVDHLVCVDRRMVQEALDSHFAGTIYTRKDWAHFYKNNPVKILPDLPYQGTTRPDEPFQWGSGPYAVLLAAMLDDHVNLFGFDLHSPTQFVNNIYKILLTMQMLLNPQWIQGIGYTRLLACLNVSPISTL